MGVLVQHVEGVEVRVQVRTLKSFVWLFKRGSFFQF